LRKRRNFNANHMLLVIKLSNTVSDTPNQTVLWEIFNAKVKINYGTIIINQILQKIISNRTFKKN